jgi:acetyltransferase-like isoleucine patch superfamily enzyme
MLKKLKKIIFLIVNRIERSNRHDDVFVKICVWCIKERFGYLGKNINLQKGIQLVGIENIYVDNNSGIGRNCYIFANEKVIIGKNVLIAPEVILHTSNHKMDRSSPIIEQGFVSRPIIIEDDVWIAARATILSGVKLARGTVVAAGSVVTKDTEQFGIYGGIPARKIGERR